MWWNRRWLLALLLVPGWARAQAVDPVFGAFERNYKQALWQSSQAHPAEAGAALGATKAAWLPLVPGLLGSGEAGIRLAVEISGRLAVAEQLQAGGDLAELHELLEPVRVALGHYRTERGEWRLNDKLTGFHGTMEAVLLAPDGKPWPQATPQAMTRWRSLLPQLRSQWAAATALVTDDSEAARLQPLMQPESLAIERLAATLRGDDAGAMLAAAKSLKPAFAKVFLGVEPTP